MVTKIYWVKDNKAGIYRFPVMAAAMAVALRQVAEAAMDPKTELYQYPSDFELWSFGTFNDESGEYKTHSPEFVCSVMELSLKHRAEIAAVQERIAKHKEMIEKGQTIMPGCEERKVENGSN